MADECFDQLRVHGEKIDKGLEALTTTWKTPSALMRGYGGDLEDVQSQVQGVIDSIVTLKESIAADHVLAASNVSQMQDFLSESRKAYEDLCEQCNDLETVFIEYGYVGPEIRSPGSSSQQTESDDTDAPLSDGVEFTPNLKWHHTAKRSSGDEIPPNFNNCTPDIGTLTPAIKPQRSIATPVIKSVASVLSAHSMSCDRAPGSLKKLPRSPVYSSQFYDIMKEQ